MKLKDNTTYMDAGGNEVRIMGPTRNHHEYVWSIAGFWYVRETGRRLNYRVIRDDNGRDIGGEHVPFPDGHRGHIVKAAP